MRAAFYLFSPTITEHFGAYLLKRYASKDSTVIGVSSIVAQHKDSILWNGDGSPGSGSGIGNTVARPIDEKQISPSFNGLTRKSNHSLNERTGAGLVRAKGDNIVTLQCGTVMHRCYENEVTIL